MTALAPGTVAGIDPGIAAAMIVAETIEEVVADQSLQSGSPSSAATSPMTPRKLKIQMAHRGNGGRSDNYICPMHA